MNQAPPDARLTVRLTDDQRLRLERIAAAGVPKGRVLLEGLDARLCAWEHKLGIPSSPPRRRARRR